MSRLPRSVEAELAKLGVTDLSRVSVDGQPIQEAMKVGRQRAVDDKYKSKAERLYAYELELQQQQGVITWWNYEPWTLVIVEAAGKRCRYTPDFVALQCDGMIRCVEIKGFLREAARIRFLAARERYPFLRFTMIRRTKSGWETIL